jgi:hypothetical protein
MSIIDALELSILFLLFVVLLGLCGIALEWASSKLADEINRKRK